MAGGTEKPEWPLQGQFRRYKVKGNPCDIRIDETGFTVSSKGDGASGVVKQEVLKASDLVGCMCMKAGPAEARTHLAFFTIFAYPLNDKGKKRRRVTFSFEVDKEDTFEKNLEIAETWRSGVYRAIRIFGTANPQTDKSKKLLMLINPNSGPGKAQQIYKKQVASVFGEAETDHEVIITERANHAREIVQSLNLAKYSGIVILSGDGLLFEVYNGLFERPDWEQAIQYPIGMIPGGSGNGLARSLGQWLNEPYLANPVLVSTLNVVYGHLSPLDLAIVQTAEGKRLLSFLSIGFGLISDIDIESERLRSIGEARFVAWSFIRVANLRKYPAKISFKRAQRKTSNQIPKVRPPLMHSQTFEEEPEVASEALPDHLPRSQSVVQEVETLYTEDGSGQECGDGGQQNHKRGVESENESNRDNHALTDDCLIPDLNEPVPEDWETIEDNFIMVHATYQSHIATDAFIAPEATPNDGIMWIMMIRGSTPKSSIAKLLLGLDGTHVNVPGIEMIPVVALRIVPASSNGYLNVDGEVIPWGPVQAHILPRRGNIMTR
ncbi:sphingosine kinase 1-like isoform X2 [Homarus americanus]|uniref:sphingosine kinase n=1 Tax=Homarus americanus TaxID=6706 RepID=A0A8J5JGY3_HOMAM|nr:sphingosine kinase 1-like isoform X2 [Homarus americanus]KAG7154183.1 Sphingosine kinase 1-like [Homarus americanus]